MRQLTPWVGCVSSAALLLPVLAACSRDQPVEATSVAAASSVAPRPAAAKRCLPVVAASCGCVYSCGSGTEVSPGTRRVVHPFWAPTPITAKVAPWCVDGACTDAFHGEIVCSGICRPKPADPTCHFDGAVCVSGRDASP